MAKFHEYPVTVSWRGGRDGEGAVLAEHSNSTFPLRVPPEFHGPGGGTNPEELLTSAIAACFTITFGIVATTKRLPVVDIRTEASGVVEESKGSFRYTSISIKPRIVLALDATDEHIEQALDAAHRADGYCIITNAVRASVNIEVIPEIVRG